MWLERIWRAFRRESSGLIDLSAVLGIRGGMVDGSR